MHSRGVPCPSGARIDENVGLFLKIIDIVMNGSIKFPKISRILRLQCVSYSVINSYCTVFLRDV
jgi:hypothetical protein